MRTELNLAFLSLGLLVFLPFCGGEDSTTNTSATGDIAQHDLSSEPREDSAADSVEEPSPDTTSDTTSDTAGDTAGDVTIDDPAVDTAEDSSVDPSEDTAPDTAMEVDSGPELDLEPETDTSVDSPTDTLEDVQIDGSSSIQTPITFVVRNTSSETVYVDGYSYANNLIQGGRTTGGALLPAAYWSPGCTVNCDSVEAGSEECCIMCVPAPSVYPLGPGEQFDFLWNGEHLFTTDSAHCMCPCYRANEVVAMHYTARACIYNRFDCWSEIDPCEPDEFGAIHGANVAGDPVCTQAEFDIPYTGTEIIIEVE